MSLGIFFFFFFDKVQLILNVLGESVCTIVHLQYEKILHTLFLAFLSIQKGVFCFLD